jgi:cytochrome P450
MSDLAADVGPGGGPEFDPFSRDFYDDPYDTYHRLRDEAPCFRSERWGFYALSRFEDVVEASKRTDLFTSTHGINYEHLTMPDEMLGAMGDLLIMKDPPEHTRYRKLVSRAFTPRSIRKYEPVVHDIIHRHLDALDGRTEADLVGEFAAPFPVEVISTILGVPEADRQQIRHWTDAMLRREEGQSVGTPEQAEAALNQAQYFADLVVEKRKTPGDDMLSVLCEAEVEDEHGGGRTRLTDSEIISFGTLLGAAGSETVTKLIGGGAVLFHRNPEQWQRVLGDRTIIPGAVEEMLRYWPPSQYQGRMATRESEWHGVTIPERAPVLLLTGSAAHDPRHYHDPDRFDITREPSLAIGFGHGVHACLGAALARMESVIAFEQIRDRWPGFSVDESGLERVQMSNVAGYSRVPVRLA